MTGLVFAYTLGALLMTIGSGIIIRAQQPLPRNGGKA